MCAEGHVHIHDPITLCNVWVLSRAAINCVVCSSSGLSRCASAVNKAIIDSQNSQPNRVYSSILRTYVCSMYAYKTV